MVLKQRGAHAGARTLRAYPWHQALCVFLAVALCVCPLGLAYGQDADNSKSPVQELVSADVDVAAVDSSSGDSGGSELGAQPASDAVDAEQATVDSEAVEGAAVASVPDAIDAAHAADATVVPSEDATELGDAEGDAAAVDDGTGEAKLSGGDAASAEEDAALDDEPSSGQEDVSALASTAGENATANRAVLAPVEGVITLLVIVTGFLGADGAGAVPYDNSYDWATSIFGSSNSLADYYDTMSSGKFTFTPAEETSAYGENGNTNTKDAPNDGIVHVTLPEAHGNWAGKYTESDAVATSMLSAFEHALEKASEVVDFARYDSDDDGSLANNELSIAFIVAGYETSLLSVSHTAPWYSLWGHQWSYTNAGRVLPRVDGVTVDSYVAVGEKSTDIVGDKVVSSQTPYAIITHEMGHVLGLPDLYDTAAVEGDDWWEYTVDEASLMGTGNYAVVGSKGGATVYKPTALDAWSRYQLGWTTPTVVTKSGVYTVSAQNSKRGYTTLLIPTKRKGEYYIIENRTFSGYDAGLASSYDGYKNGGIVIWHIDNGVISRYLATNEVNASTHRPGVMPLYAEEGENKAGDWVYTLDYKTSSPDTSLLFWTKSMWKKYFGSAAALNLPLYGKGKKGDDPMRRLFSGVRIQFLTNAGPDMKIRIVMPGDELPQQTDAKKTPAVAATACDYADPYVEAIPATGDEQQPWGAVFAAVASLAMFAFARRKATFTAKHARSCGI